MSEELVQGAVGAFMARDLDGGRSRGLPRTMRAVPS
jgi:hypothetical protein